MSLRDNMPRDDNKKRPRLSKEYYLTFRSKVNTYAKNHCENPVRMGVYYLSSPVVDQTTYFAMTNPQKAAHAEDDAALGDAIEHVIHFQDAHITAPFGANEVRNAPPPAQQDPTVPSWWPSPAKASLDAIRAKFGSITTSAVSLLKTKLMTMRLSDFQDVPLFEAAFTTLMDTYLSAAVSAGINTSSLDQDLALHLVDLFTQWHTQYHTAMSLLRQTMPHTVAEVLTAANLEYDANPTRKTQQGPTVLQSSADQPVDLVRLLSTVLERLPAPKAPGHRGSDRGAEGTCANDDSRAAEALGQVQSCRYLLQERYRTVQPRYQLQVSAHPVGEPGHLST